MFLAVDSIVMHAIFQPHIAWTVLGFLIFLCRPTVVPRHRFSGLGGIFQPHITWTVMGYRWIRWQTVDLVFIVAVFSHSLPGLL